MRSVGSTGADSIVSLLSPHLHCVHLIRADKQATCSFQGYAKYCSLLGLAILLCYHTEKAHNTHQCKSKNAICEVTKRGQNASGCSPMFDDNPQTQQIRKNPHECKAKINNMLQTQHSSVLLL